MNTLFRLSALTGMLVFAVYGSIRLNAQPWQETSLRDIKAEGWLEEKLISQKNGLTGHPEALSYPYNTCLWNGEIPRMGTHGQDWWRYEQTAYYTDGLLRLGYLLGDKELIDKGEAGISYTLAHPWENGRLGSRVISNTWPFAVFFRAVKAADDVSPDALRAEALRKHYYSIPLKQLVRKRDIISCSGLPRKPETKPLLTARIPLSASGKSCWKESM